jgi:hypothetical protein
VADLEAVAPTLQGPLATEATAAPKTGEEANLALQLLLRTSLERRYLHTWLAAKLEAISSALQMVALVGATVS